VSGALVITGDVDLLWSLVSGLWSLASVHSVRSHHPSHSIRLQRSARTVNEYTELPAPSPTTTFQARPSVALRRRSR
jgi:hypothetical protein